MSIVHGIIEDHGGSIELESAESIGTTVRLRFPSVDCPMIPKRPSTRPINLVKQKVLIAEDCDSLRTALATQLEQLDYKVTECSDGHDALRMLEKEDGHFDLLLFDINLPGVDGETCVNRILQRKPNINVILMSGASQPQSSSFEFIRKPFAKEELVELLTRVGSSALSKQPL